MPRLHIALALVALAAFPAGTAYGHGLGLDHISSVDVGGKEVSITVEMPLDIAKGQDMLTVTATDDMTGKAARNVTFLIGLFHGGEMVFRNYFLADDGMLKLKVSQQGEGFEIVGGQDPFLGAYRNADGSPVELRGPVFKSGGLYTFEIEIRTIGEPTNIIKDSGTHTADLSVATTTVHLESDSEGNGVEFRLKSYFDKVTSLDYDPVQGRVAFEMPFDWSEGRVSHIPVVHEEVHFPKGFAEFLSPSYAGRANGVELFKSSINVDDYTEEEERIVHFVLLQEHLRYVKNELKKSGEPLPDNIVFELEKSDEVSFPLSAYTKTEDYEVNLSWEPVNLEPGVETDFVFTIRDGATGEPLRDSAYTISIIQGGQEIHRTSGIARIGGDAAKFTFGEGQTGPTIVRFEDIRGTGQQTEFGIVVAPEFGGVAMVILAGSAAATILAARRLPAF